MRWMRRLAKSVVRSTFGQVTKVIGTRQDATLPGICRVTARFLHQPPANEIERKLRGPFANPLAIAAKSAVD